MTGVALRCPHCGTVQSTAGECEACHAGAVRYFCTNHDPGIWSDTPTCSQCGARFGAVVAPPVITLPVPDFAPEPERPAPRAPPLLREDVPYREVARNPWVDLLVTASRMRRPASFAPETSDGLPIAAPLGGCVKRLLMLFLVLAGLFVLGALLVGGFLLQLF